MIQKNLRVVEIRDLQEAKKIVESKYIELVKNNYFLLNEPNKEIEEYLKANGIKYLVKNGVGCDSDVRIVEKIVEVTKNQENVIYNRIIRSGEEINSNDNLIFYKELILGQKLFAVRMY